MEKNYRKIILRFLKEKDKLFLMTEIDECLDKIYKGDNNFLAIINHAFYWSSWHEKYGYKMDWLDFYTLQIDLICFCFKCQYGFNISSIFETFCFFTDNGWMACLNTYSKEKISEIESKIKTYKIEIENEKLKYENNNFNDTLSHT